MFRYISTIQRGAPRIFGDLTITVDTSNTDKVEFILDRILQHVDDEAPFEWDFDATNGFHTVETIAYNAKSISKDIIDVFVLL